MIQKQLTAGGKDLSQLVEKVTWSGDSKQVARKLAFSIATRSTDRFLPKVTINEGDSVLFRDGDRTLFGGPVFDIEKSASGNLTTFTAFDLMFYINNSDISKVFDDTPEAITAWICSHLGVPFGSAAPTGIKVYLPWLGKKAYEAIMAAYTTASRQNGKKYIPLMQNVNQVCVIERGTLCGVVLDGGYNLTEATYKPSLQKLVDRVIVTDKNGNPVEVTVRPDGTYTFIQPAGKVKIEVTYKRIETPWNNPFSDVSEGDWYYEAVRFVQEQGLMNGIGNGNFAPNAQLSRAQLAQILFNKEGRPGVNYLLTFPDVAGEAWYTEAVRWAASQGIAGGYGNGLFGPNDNLSRAQFAQILFNREGRPVVNYLLQYGDVAEGAWYTEAIRWATSQGIVGGYGNGMFGPNDNITREQLAVMLWRYAGSPAATDKELHFTDADKASGYALEALRWAVENGILNGYGDGRLGPQGLATRAQVAQMLMNFLKDE